MNVMIVGLLSMALYAIVAAAWIRYDRRKDIATGAPNEESRP